ncbi:MAG: hypothetical protein ACLFWM_08700 [Actinomycetota bacterium]
MVMVNVFVLGTGRCGTTTFARACNHITNHTSGHETRSRNWRSRLDYPADHIEVDHRLAFFLGTIQKRWGDDATYVHLTRDPEKVARSWSVRLGEAGMMRNWPRAVFYRPKGLDHLTAARIMVRTITDNIEMFLRDKTRVVRMDIEGSRRPFMDLWEMIGAEGDLAGALETLDRVHNARRRR